MPLIALLFLALPFVELFVIVQVARAVGTPQTLVALLVVSIVGAWLVKVAGLGVWRRFTTTAARGEMPHREVVDGVLLLMAGALLLIPGFVTDLVGLVFVFPPTRAVVRTALIGRFQAGTTIAVFGRGPRGVVETQGWETDTDPTTPTRPDDDPPEIGR
ncbi:MAG: FxsA family protein [Acidimicrobiales bacterium]